MVIHCVRHLLIEDKVVPLDPEQGDVVLSTAVASMKMEKPRVGVALGQEHHSGALPSNRSCEGC